MLKIFFLDQTFDHIVGRNQDIISFTTGKLGVHHLIGFKCLIYHCTVIFFFKFLQQVGINILSCIVNLQHMFSLCHIAPLHKSHSYCSHQNQGEDFSCFPVDSACCKLLKHRHKIGQGKYQYNDNYYNG